MSTGSVDRLRNIEAMRLPCWTWLPASIRERIESHNTHLEKLAQQWARHDEATEEALHKVLTGPLPTSAQLQEVKSKLHNGAMGCLKAELAIVGEDTLGPLLEAIQAACATALDDSIESHAKTEQSQIGTFLKANGFASPEAAGPRLPFIEGQARQSQPCCEAAAMIEETRQAGWAISALGNEIRAYRTNRLQAVRKMLAEELRPMTSFATTSPVELGE